MEPAARAPARRASVTRARGPRRSARHERVFALHPAADRNIAARDRRHAGRHPRLSVAAGVLAAAGRFPHHPGHDPASGREPRRDGVTGDGAARAQFRTDSLASGDDVLELVRDQPDHAAVRPRARHRCRRAGCAGRDQCVRIGAAEKPALSAGLFQGEPGRCADGDAGDHLRYDLAAPAQRHRRYFAGAAAERGDRRRPRHGAGQYPAGDPHPGGSLAPRQLRHRARGCAQRHRRRECRGRQRRARRRAPVLHDLRQRSDHRGRGLPHHHHSLPQRRAGAAAGRGRRGRWPREQPGRRLLPGDARHRGRHPAPARRQRDRDGAAHQERAAETAALDAHRRHAHRGARRHREHPRLGP